TAGVVLRLLPGYCRGEHGVFLKQLSHGSL
ncbi:hypothetical protein DBR06_SOUSAS3410152, partial [Sousa chinensis]